MARGQSKLARQVASLLKQEEDATTVDLRMALRDAAVVRAASALERVKAVLIDTGKEMECSVKAAEAIERRNVNATYPLRGRHTDGQSDCV